MNQPTFSALTVRRGAGGIIGSHHGAPSSRVHVPPPRDASRTGITDRGSRGSRWIRRLVLPLLLAGVLRPLTLGAQTNFVTLGNYLAHPTRILARFKDGTPSRFSTEAVR